MRNRIVITSIFTLLVFNYLQAQKTQSYSRSSISTIFLKHTDDNLSLFNYVNSIQVTSKFDYNYFGNNSMNVDFQMVSPAIARLNSLQASYNELLNIKEKDKSTWTRINALADEIKNTEKEVAIENSHRYSETIDKIKQNRIANKALGSILIDPGLGYMTTETMAARGSYNASDAEYMTAMNSEIKLAMLQDKGEGLLKNTYLFVFDINNYEIKNTDEKDNRLKTYAISGTVYLIQIRVDSLMENGEWNNLIFQEVNAQKLENFNNYNFPLTVLYSNTFYASMNNYKIDAAGTGINMLLNAAKTKKDNNNGGGINYIFRSDEEIQLGLLNNSIKSGDESFTKSYEPFNVKASVFSANPLSVKIGKKEGLVKDQLYKVSENTISKSGVVSERKIGWIRAKKITNNKFNATGKTQPSIFYKVASKKIEKGMKVKHISETGIIVGVGYNYNISNISKGILPVSNGVMDGPFIQIDYITHLAPGLRIGIDFGGFQKVSTKDIVEENNNLSTGYTFKGTNMFADLLIQKIFQANRLEFTPYIGGYYSTVTFDKFSDDGFKTEYKTEDYTEAKGLKNTQLGISGGVKLGFNLGKYFQINAGFKYWKSLSDETKNDKNSNFFTSNVKYEFSQPGAVSVGIRLFGF